MELRADTDYRQWVQVLERTQLFERVVLEDLPGFKHGNYTIAIKAAVNADLHEDITAGSSKLYRLVNVVGVSVEAMEEGAAAILKRLFVFAVWFKVNRIFDRLNVSTEEARATANGLLVDAVSVDGFKFIKESLDQIDDGKIVLVEVKPEFFERCFEEEPPLAVD